MADNETPADGPEGGAPADSGDKGGDKGDKGDKGEGKTFTQADVDRIAGERAARERAKFGDYDDLKVKASELDAIREGEKTELQKALDRAAAAESRAESVEFDRLRDRIANRPGKVVPVASLTGKTEAELIASADALIAWRDENAPKPPEAPKKRNPAGSGGGFKSGATGADSGSQDPKVKAVEALRRLRSGE
ncbi:scaffolding protein [Mycobacterium phage Cain]|uniref:Scaffolding protein n=1 Tax=Mycobacterium phage Bryler TaxID=2653755 RepID=A0A5Q2WRC5_9CAUD|nr:head scaffolding protein [Mycobacterium phage Bryler]ASR85411.1 scaffolding protein [Mycobacterium phage Cain]QGH80387.1 scaffolding protein [Mycobacterium phage Bryler]